MTVKPRRPMGGRPGPQRSAGDLVTAKATVGRPQGEPSTIVNVRLPLTWWLRSSLSRSAGETDRLQGQPRHDHAAGISPLFGVTRPAEDARGGRVRRGYCRR